MHKSQLIQETGVVVGVTRMSSDKNAVLESLTDYLYQHDICAPVLEVDPRNREDVIELMDALMAILEFA